MDTEGLGVPASLAQGHGHWAGCAHPSLRRGHWLRTPLWFLDLCAWCTTVDVQQVALSGSLQQDVGVTPDPLGAGGEPEAGVVLLLAHQGTRSQNPVFLDPALLGGGGHSEQNGQPPRHSRSTACVLGGKREGPLQSA